jgi:hypothetical protein
MGHAMMGLQFLEHIRTKKAQLAQRAAVMQPSARFLTRRTKAARAAALAAAALRVDEEGEDLLNIVVAGVDVRPRRLLGTLTESDTVTEAVGEKAKYGWLGHRHHNHHWCA